jgi:hypothetical protein
MKRVILFLATVSVVVSLSLRAQGQASNKSNTATPNAGTDSLATVTEKLRNAMGDCPFNCSVKIEDVACVFRPAVWAGLPVTLRVSWSQTKDGKARAFVMKDGHFSEVIDDKEAQLLAGNMTTMERGYGVTFKGPEEAFGKGAPFYVSEVAFESPTVFHFTVISNPAVSVDYGQIVIQETGEGYNLSLVKDFVKSDAKPQRLTKTLTTPLDPKKKTYLFIADRHGCILSNEHLLMQ